MLTYINNSSNLIITPERAIISVNNIKIDLGPAPVILDRSASGVLNNVCRELKYLKLTDQKLTLNFDWLSKNRPIIQT